MGDIIKIIGLISGDKKCIAHFVKLYEKDIIKGKHESQFFIEIESESLEKNDENIKHLNRELKRLVEKLKVLGKFHKCYGELNINQYTDKKENIVFGYTVPISVNVNVTGGIETYDKNGNLIESCFTDEYGFMKVINHETNEIKEHYTKIKTSRNENNYHIKSALDYMADSNDENIYIKANNAFEAINEFFKDKYDVKSKSEFHDKLKEIGVVISKRENVKFTETLNAKNDLKGRHHRYGECENGMTKTEIKEFIYKILRQILKH